ncbi:MAG: radical SAM protein, partial [Pseudomonadota bacterium]
MPKIFQRLLIYPPFADPTWPYISLPSLKGHLVANQLPVKTLDWNIEGIHYLHSPQFIELLAGRIAQRFLELNKKKSLSPIEQLEYVSLSNGRRLVRSFRQEGVGAIEVFKNQRNFYNFPNYLWARRRMEDLFAGINSAYFPVQFGFNQAKHLVAPWDLNSLEAYFTQAQSPLDHFYRQEISAWPEVVDFVGISLTFISQIPETFYLLRLIRELRPKIFLMVGGTGLHQIWRQSPLPVKKELYRWADAFCPYEGEEALQSLFRHFDQGDLQSCLEDIPNTVFFDGPRDLLIEGPIKTLNLANAALPDYQDLDLSLYLAPRPMLLYAPTRGCYWNRCSFCEYGPNQTGQHPYRQIPPELAAQQLQELSKRHQTHHFYLSCDVLAPAYAVQLAELLAEEKRKIFWSADLRIESYFTPERCQILYQGGMRAVAFGVESGSNRLLQLMNKGITKEQIITINSFFHQANIATNWMTFTYHPGEKKEEALETLQMIEQNQGQIDLFIVGEFGATPHSPVVLSPDNFGIKNIFYTAGDQFRLFPLLKLNDRQHSSHYRQEIGQKISELSSAYFLSNYPWAGSISTHHSFLYFLQFGPKAFHHSFGNNTPRPPFRAKKKLHLDNLKKHKPALELQFLG